MGRLTWSQLRYRTGRTVALLLGVLLATTAFTVLTSASRTAQLRTIGTLSAHFHAAYQILVRPHGSRTPLETKNGTVQPDFLSGIYGGITLAQYHRIQNLPGVSVAAPIAMVGYSLPLSEIPVRLPAAKGRELYRIDTSWVSGRGTSRIVQPPSFVYTTPNRLASNQQTGATYEVVPSGRRQKVCTSLTRATDPFGSAVQAHNWCWSTRNGLPGSTGELTAAHPGYTVEWALPILIAAVDPVAEAKLDGLDRSLTTGRYLTEGAGQSHFVRGASTLTGFPVLATTRPGLDESAVVDVQRLQSPTSPPALGVRQMAAEGKRPGHTVQTLRTTADQAYKRLLSEMKGSAPSYPGITQYWTVGPVRYEPSATDRLHPVQVHNPSSVWRSALASAGFVAPGMDNADKQYRTLRGHAPTSPNFRSGGIPIPIPRLVGTFDPNRIQQFDPLSRVPLGLYRPTAAIPADSASRAALGNSSLLPNLNLGGLLGQPPQLITSLSSLPALDNTSYFSGQLHAHDPISVIRVRVAGATGPDPVSLDRIRLVAQQIAAKTGLLVDIVAGSSPAPTTVAVPAGRYGEPPLLIDEPWVKKGVAVAILSAVNKESVLLFALILVVCALFVGNAATAAVRSRRQELGVLACLGWTRPRLFAAIIGELTAIGLAAGTAGGLIAAPLAAAVHLHASPARAALAVPVAVLVAVVAGALPAWQAANTTPMNSVRPPVVAARRTYHPSGVTGLAIVNVLRVPGRTLIAAVSLAVGVAGLTILVGVTLAFRGSVVTSVLGSAIAVQVRGVDFVAVSATAALGVLAVIDVLFLNVRERAGEYATIRTFGWREGDLRRLIATEGAMIGVAGSLVGAGIGLAGAATLGRGVPTSLVTVAFATAVCGAVLASIAAGIPAYLLRRLPDAEILGQE